MLLSLALALACAALARARTGAPSLCCFVTARPWRCHRAMRAHATQYVWYRKLYVLTSRYVCVNTLRRRGGVSVAKRNA